MLSSGLLIVRQLLLLLITVSHTDTNGDVRWAPAASWGVVSVYFVRCENVLCGTSSASVSKFPFVFTPWTRAFWLTTVIKQTKGSKVCQVNLIDLSSSFWVQSHCCLKENLLASVSNECFQEYTQRLLYVLKNSGLEKKISLSWQEMSLDIKTPSKNMARCVFLPHSCQEIKQICRG